MSSGLKINLKKKLGTKKLKPTLNSNSAENESNSKTLIDTYTKTEPEKSEEPKKWIIKPKKISSSINVEPVVTKEEEKLKYGVTEFDKTETVNQISVVKKLRYESDEEEDDDENDQIPPEEFGAAFLRGLGWDGKDGAESEEEEEETKKESKEIRNRQKGITLGIGAKPINIDLAKDLQNQESNGVPLIKRRKIDKKSDET
ncbi:SPP2 [Candida pseudojiufengensis]|uniref:SPP2 n=1 Tax=Candida pseudojiufengensis TaxID=497109 RepID=UPI0022244E90|nr:SPP2 [Candida pseudojiufengensis]KAI5961867.1 SPP2 [Candida pseudojiufengensis]